VPPGARGPQGLPLATPLPASYCDCHLTGTWSAWSWIWLAIAASPLQQTEQVTTHQEWHTTEIRTGIFLFKIYNSESPTMVSRKYTQADDLAIMHADGDYQAVGGVLSRTWQPLVNTSKPGRAQRYKYQNPVGSLASQQQGSLTWTESQPQQRNLAFS